MSDKPRKSAYAWAVSAPALIVFTASFITGFDALLSGAREANTGAREANIGYVLVGLVLIPASAYTLWRVVVAQPRADVPRANRKPKA